MCRSVRIERIDNRGIRSVKCGLRFVSRISLVGLRIFSWQEWLYTVCRSVRIERIDNRGYTVCKVCVTVRKSHLLERAYCGFWVVLIYRRRKITFGVCLSWFLRLCWFMVYRGMCGFALLLVHRLYNEECVALRLRWFMVYRTRNITSGVFLSWFLRLCWSMVYRTRNITAGVRLSWFLRLCWFMVNL